MEKRTVVAPKHKIFNHKRYTLYPLYPKTKASAEALAEMLRKEQVVGGVKHVTRARVDRFGGGWAVYYWENQYYSKTKRKIVTRR